MSYMPPPPPPMKRSYPGDWNPPPVRPAKESRPLGQGDYYGQSDYNWGQSYSGSDYGSDYGYYGWGNQEYRESTSYQPTQQPQYEPDSYQDRSLSNRGDSSVDFTDDYSAFYGKEQSWSRPRGNQRGRGNHWRGGNQWGRGGGHHQEDTNNTTTNLPSTGQFSQNAGQFSPNAGQFSQNRGQGNQNRGQSNRGGPQANRGANRGGQRGQFRGRGRGFQRGMPPNVFSSPKRGRGSNRGSVVVPPVHSLAKAKPEILDIQNMSLAEKLHRFCLFLRSEDSIKTNAIQTIMNAVTSSKLGLKVNYESEELSRVSGKAMYTGVLKLDTVFLARAIWSNKKDLKQEVFQKALTVMLTLTVAEIYNLVDPGSDAIREELERQRKAAEPEPEPTTGESNTEENKSSEEAKTLVGGDIQSILTQLINALNNMKTTPNSPVAKLQQAFTQGHIILKHEYQIDVSRMRNGLQYCRGVITMGKLVLGRGWGITKKKCKTDTYVKVTERLLTLDMTELMKSVPEEPIPEHVELATRVDKDVPIEEKFEGLLRSLGSMTCKENNISQIDMAAMANGITPMIIFKLDSKKGEQYNNIICELYLEKIFLASADGTMRRECTTRAYNTAWDVLTTTSVETLLTQHRRITDEETKDPELLDVIMKGTGRTVESNIAGLKRYGHNIEDLEKRTIEDMVIVEHFDWSKDRFRNSFCILQYSCNQNGMILQWETNAVKKSFKCVVSVQRQVIGESYGQNKTHARNLAASDALFKLYEKLNVLKINQRTDDDKKWIPYESLKEEATKLKNEWTGEEPDVKTDEHGNPLPDFFLMKVLQGKVDTFVNEKDPNAELILGPGIKVTEGRELRGYTRNFELKCDTLYHLGQVYLLVYWKMEWKDLVELLKGRGDTPYGKFSLVCKDEIPKYDQISDNIIKEEDLNLSQSCVKKEPKDKESG